MPEFGIPDKSFTVTYLKRKGFRNIAQAMSANVITNLQNLIWIPRLGTVTPLEFDISYGITGIIGGSIRMEWYLVLVDVNNLPLIEGASERAIWSSAQFWQLSTAVGFQQMLSRDLADFFNPASFSFHEVADFTQRLVIALVGFQNTTEAVDAVGVITWQETLIQRVFGGDSATFDDSDSKWIDDFSDEEDEDND